MKVLMSIIIALITLYNTSADCPQTPACFGGSCECGDWGAWTERMEAFDMGSYGFPQCTLWVWYCYRQCRDSVQCTEIFISTIQAALPYCGQCEGFIEWLLQDDEWSRARRARNLLNYLFRQIVLRDWFRFLEDIGQENWPYCDEPYSPRKKYTWWQAQCRGYCFTQYPTGQPNIRLLITLKDCTEPYCCGREITLCVDRATGETRMETNRVGGPPVECPSIRVPISDRVPMFNLLIV